MSEHHAEEVPQTENDGDQQQTIEDGDDEDVNAPTLAKIKNMSFPLMVASSNQRHPKNITTARFLKKITHLNCNDKKIVSMKGVEICKKLKNLYLYNNNLKKIESISGLQDLTHLYLENNQISKIENLPTSSLQKLYLNENDIIVIENLEECARLTELHVAGQRLPPRQPLSFAPSVLNTLSQTLLVLNMKDCNLFDVSPILNLPLLRKLNLSKNNICGMDHALSLMQLEDLLDLDLRGNPVVKVPKYMENIVANCPPDFVRLDGNEVHENHKVCLKALVAYKSRGGDGTLGGGRGGHGMDMGMMRDTSDMSFGVGEGGGNDEEWGAQAGAIDFVDGQFK